MLVQGKLSMRDKITTDGSCYLECIIERFDKTKLNMNIFRKNSYNENNHLYDEARALNGKNVIIECEPFDKFIVRNPISIKESPEDMYKIDIEGLKGVLKTHLRGFSHPSYAEFTRNFINRTDVKTDFFRKPASDKGAFAVEGGLLKYTVDKLELIDALGTFLTNYLDLNLEFLKMIALTGEIGKLYTYDIVDGVAIRTYEGKFINEKEKSHYIISEILTSTDFGFTEEEKILLLQACKADDTMKNKTETCKSKESLILTSVKYLSELVNNLAMLKATNLNDFEFMDMFGQVIYVKNL